MAGAGGTYGEDESGGYRVEEVREQDRYLPIANISRIMKKSLPSNAKIAKDAKETMQECVSEFISFITSEASDKCRQEKRKTINGDDLLFAMTTLGFDKYVEPLKLYLNKYRDVSARSQPVRHRSYASTAHIMTIIPTSLLKEVQVTGAPRTATLWKRLRRALFPSLLTTAAVPALVDDSLPYILTLKTRHFTCISRTVGFVFSHIPTHTHNHDQHHTGPRANYAIRVTMTSSDSRV